MLCQSSIAFYDKKKKTILDKGSSRPCGKNHNRISIHAEQRAINYCRENDKRNRYQIFIWRYSKDGSIKPARCCHACSKLVRKFHYEDKIFTFDTDQHNVCQICPAMSESPGISLGYKILHNL